jgi:hypothetical protein
MNPFRRPRPGSWEIRPSGPAFRMTRCVVEWITTAGLRAIPISRGRPSVAFHGV